MPRTPPPSNDQWIGPPPKRPSAAWALFTGTAVLTLLAVAIIGVPTSMGPAADWAIRILCLTFAVIWLAEYSRRRYWAPQARSHRPTRVWALPDEQVDILRRSAGRTTGDLNFEVGDAIQAKVFTLSTIRPSAVRQRLTERYEQAPGMLLQRVTMDVQVPERIARRTPYDRSSPQTREDETSQQTVVLFPVIIPRKGYLIDNLKVMDAAGASVPILSYRQYLQLVARVLRTLLILGYRLGGSALPPSVLDAERLALSAIMKRQSGGQPDNSGVLALNRLVDGNAPAPTNPAAVRLAAQLAERLMSSYAIVAAATCPASGRFVITYERSITPQIDLVSRRSSLVSWVKARLRLLLGARPVELQIRLENAWTSQSYHLIVDGEDRVFVGTQQSMGLIDYFEAHAGRIEQSRLAGQESDPPPPPYYRFKRRDGQRYAHFYSRFFPEPLTDLPKGDRVPTVRFRFHEIPPGSIFRALVAATASVLLIWLIGFVISRTSDPGTDVPAFLLVFPAIAAAWLGFDTPSGRLLEGTLAARLSLVLTAVCSLAASGLFMIFRTDLQYLRWENPFGLRVLGIDKVSWSLLTLVATFNFLGIAYVYLGRAWEFAHLASQHDGIDPNLPDPD